MNTIYLEPKQVPSRLVGGYSGRKFKAIVTDTITLTDTYWSGGSRSTYNVVALNGTHAGPIHGNFNPPQFGGNMEGKQYDIRPGLVVVEHSIFCGKDMGLTFHVNPADAQALLPAAVSLDAFEVIVLAATAGLKSSYGGIKNFRFVEASKVSGITLGDWESAKQRLIGRKYLNKAGAITPAGRNAVGDKRLPYTAHSVYEEPHYFTA